MGTLCTNCTLPFQCSLPIKPRLYFGFIFARILRTQLKRAILGVNTIVGLMEFGLPFIFLEQPWDGRIHGFVAGQFLSYSLFDTKN